MKKALQYTDEFPTEAEALTALEFLKTQADFLGGRLLPPPAKGWWESPDAPAPTIWKLQAFFEPTLEPLAWLPDGFRPVLVPLSMAASLGF